MSELKLKFFCKTENETVLLGEKISRLCHKGDVLALNGTLGVGKSVLARAFIQKICGKTDVPSPTFTLVQTYETKDFDVYHFDLYRLKSPEEIFELGMEEAMYDGVCLIEWPEKMGGYLPKKSIIINIKHQPEGREIEIFFPNEDMYQRFCVLKEKNA